ncbi:hypothetical protein BDN70DRAFT_884329 [Pholiota conissans]|uniref:RING-type domain-containing protein n=1 Tax=Pholiota conissans TaxID=109636 RepID=A0A9P5YVZ3_9AGAR|nr:hypothetical protein BDN70DRAFT_884329 [Pholiota conissans]
MECPICLFKLEDSAVSLTCGHLFHGSCIEPLFDSRSVSLRCPICRTQSTAKFDHRHIRKVFVASTANQHASGSRQKDSNLMKESLKAAQNKLKIASDREKVLRGIIRDMETALNLSQREIDILKADTKKWKKNAQESNKKFENLKMQVDEAMKEKDFVKRERKMGTKKYQEPKRNLCILGVIDNPNGGRQVLIGDGFDWFDED